MITGSRKLELTPESILNLISSYDIFRFYFPDKSWKVNQVTNSPLRKDDNPSFLIGNRGGSLHFTDFANGDHGDCFTFVKLLFNLSSLNDVLIKIDFDFGLGISHTAPVADYKRIISEYKQPEELGKRYALLQAITRDFTPQELEYWKDYYQDIDDLRIEHIYSIKEMFLNRQRLPLADDVLRFGYFYNGYWQLYRPFAERKAKWLSNVPLSMAHGLNNLQSDKNALILDSKKDYMVCRKVFPYCCYTQNESLAAFSRETITYIKAHSKDAFYGGDSDFQGKKASFIITNEFGFKHINSPDKLLPETKDFAGWGKLEGLEELEKHFIKKGLIDYEK